MAEVTTPCPKCGGPRSIYQARTQKHLRCKRCLAAKARERYWRDPQADHARTRKWRADNPEKFRASVQIWRDQNQSRIAQANREYYLNNREAEIARSLAYTKAHPEVDAAIKHRREALKRNAVCEHGPRCVTAAFVAVIRTARCFYCDRAAQEADHFYPLSKGGLHCRDNIVPACRSCNARKRNRDPAVWLAALRQEANMPELVTLEEDGPLGPAGTQVWVNDRSDVEKPKKATPAKKTAASKADDK